MPLTDDVAVRRRVNRQALASAQRRDQILDAAAEAFTENGFNGSSIRDVAVRAGMSHTGVLHHFPDKAALLEALLDRRFAQAATQFPLDARDGVQFLRSLIALADLDRRGLFTGHGVDIPTAAAQVTGMRDGLDPQWLLDPTSIDLVGAVTAQLRFYTDADLTSAEDGSRAGTRADA